MGGVFSCTTLELLPMGGCPRPLIGRSFQCDTNEGRRGEIETPPAFTGEAARGACGAECREGGVWSLLLHPSPQQNGQDLTGPDYSAGSTGPGLRLCPSAAKHTQMQFWDQDLRGLSTSLILIPGSSISQMIIHRPFTTNPLLNSLSNKS